MAFKILRTNKAKWIAVSIAGVLLTGSIISLSSRVAAQEETKTVTSSAFSVGLLDDETGKLLTGENKDNRGFSTDLYYKFDENFKMEKVEDEFPVVVYVNVYDGSKGFLGTKVCNGDITYSDFGDSSYKGGKYIKIEVMPEQDDDDKVTWLEVSKYVNQLKITVAK